MEHNARIQDVQIQNDQTREIDFVQIIGYSVLERAIGEEERGCNRREKRREEDEEERSRIIQNRQSGRLWK